MQFRRDEDFQRRRRFDRDQRESRDREGRDFRDADSGRRDDYYYGGSRYQRDDWPSRSFDANAYDRREGMYETGDRDRRDSDSDRDIFGYGYGNDYARGLNNGVAARDWGPRQSSRFDYNSGRNQTERGFGDYERNETSRGRENMRDFQTRDAGRDEGSWRGRDYSWRDDRGDQGWRGLGTGWNNQASFRPDFSSERDRGQGGDRAWTSERGWSRSRHDDRHEHEGLWDSVKSFFGVGPKGYKRSDDRVREDVCEALARHPEVDASEIEVMVSEGTVTLKGTVSDRWTKRRAEDAVEHVSGVHDVRNEISVRRAGESRSLDTSASAANEMQSSSPGTATGSEPTGAVKRGTGKQGENRTQMQ